MPGMTNKPKPNLSQPILRRFLMSPNDIRAMEYLMARHEFPHLTNVARFCIGRELDRGPLPRSGKEREKLMKLAEEVGEISSRAAYARNDPDSFPRAQWSGRFNSQQIEGLDQIVAKYGLGSRAEAMRLVVRIRAEEEGFIPRGGWNDGQ